MRRNKQERQRAIRELVSAKKIQRQDDLVSLLNGAGWEVTQATVSRDIAELQLVKVPLPEGGFAYAVMTDDDYLSQLAQILQEPTTKVSAQENMVMIRVGAGSGPALKLALDEAKLPEIFGLVGDDAGVLVILTAGENGSVFISKLMAGVH
jgi:transcriptional regulator of arginine metabolism